MPLNTREKELLNKICELAVRLLNVNHSGFALFDSTLTNGEVIADSHNLPGLRGSTFNLTQSTTVQEIIRQDEPYVIEDVFKKMDELGEIGSILSKYNVRSICIVKVYRENIPIGSFSFESIDEVQDFDEAKLLQCKVFADLISMVLSNEDNSETLKTLLDTSFAIIAEQQFEPLLEILAKQTKFLFNALEAGFFVREQNEGKDCLVLKKSSEPMHTKQILTPEDESMAWQLINCDKPRLKTANYKTYPHKSPKFPYDGNQEVSLLQVPMIWNKERFGVIYVVDRLGRIFNENDEKMLKSLADIFTIAYQHQALRERIQRLSQVTTEFSSRLDSQSLQERLELIAKYAAELINAEVCGVFLWTKENTLELRASNYGPKPDPSLIFKIEDGEKTGLTGAIAARLLKRYKDRVDSEKEPRDKEIYQGSILRSDHAVRGTKDFTPSGVCYSLLAVPMISKTNNEIPFVGILRVSNKKGANGKPSDDIGFTEDDIWLLHIFAEAASVAIESAQIYEERHDMYEKLEVLSNLHKHLLGNWRRLESGYDSTQILNTLADKLVGLVSATFCHIFVYDESNNNLYIRAASLHPRTEKQLVLDNIIGKKLTIADWENLERRLNKRLHYELSWENPRAREVLVRVTEDLKLRTVNGKPENSYNLESEVKHLVLVPLYINDKQLGLLSIGDVREWNQFAQRKENSKSHINIAYSVAGPLSAVLYRDIKRAEFNLDKTLRDRLDDALKRTRNTTDYNALIAQIAKEVKTIHAASLGGLIIQEENGRIRFLTDAQDIEVDTVLGKYIDELLHKDSSEFLDSKEILDLLTQAIHNHELKSGSGIRFEYSSGLQGIFLFACKNEHIELISIHERVLDKFSQHCVISLTKLCADEEQKRTKKAINTIVEQLAISGHMSLKKVAEGIQIATKCDLVTIYPISENRKLPDKAPVIHGLLDYPDAVKEVPQDIENSAPGKILKKGEIHVVCTQDIDNDTIIQGEFVKRENIRAAIGTPIWLSEQQVVEFNDQSKFDQSNQNTKKIAVGVLFVNFKKTKHSFSQEELSTVNLCAHLSAIAIRNNEVYLKEKQGRERLENLLNSATKLGSPLVIEKISQQIAEEAFRLGVSLKCDVNFVSVSLANKEWYEVVSAYPKKVMDILKQKMGMHPIFFDKAYIGIVAKSIRNGQDCNLPNVGDDPDFLNVDLGTQSEIVVLIKNKDNNIIGSINVESTRLAAFSEEDFECFKLFARFAFDSLYIARQFVEVTALSDISLFYIKSGLIMHNHSSKITALGDAANKLYEKSTGELHTDLNIYIDKINELMQIVEYVKFEPSADSSMNLHETISAFVNKRRQDTDFIGVNIELKNNVPKDVRLGLDKLLFDEMLRIFAENSLKSLGSANRQISFICQLVDNNRCMVEIHDSGGGVPPEIWTKVFSERIVPSDGVGLGLGLLTIAFVIKKFGGTVHKIETGKNGTKFGLEIPVKS